MTEPVQEHRAFDSSFFFSRVLFDNQMRGRSEWRLSPVTMTTPCCDYRTRGALKLKVDVVVSVSDLPANLVLKLRMFFAWSGDRTVVCLFDCAVKRANRFKAVTSRHASCARLSHVFRMAGAKTTKFVCLQQARSIVFFCLFVLHFFFGSGIFNFRSWKGLGKVLIFFWKICANPVLSME